jgi:uncharacterized protein
MSTLAERLRGVVRPGGSKEQDPPYGPWRPDGMVRAGGSEEQDLPYQAGRPGPVDRARNDAAADVLDGEWREANGHRFLVVERKYSPGYRHGHVCVADSLPPADGVWPTLAMVEPAIASGRLLFVDLETTGLAGGAGTYAFLVGCGWFHGGTFRTRQYFLSSYMGEKALLEAVAEDAGGTAAVVTYNGKCFDLPLMETRFVMHRMATPFAGLPHVDMLHPARRLWRGDENTGEAGCRLTSLEEMLCGHRREGDVPGFEIPSRYFHYVRTGDARPLDAVLEHNRLDLLALALVTARAAQMLEDGPSAARTAREALGLGRLYERAGRAADAYACYLRAGELPGDVATHAEALRAYALASRRRRCYDDAAAAWRRILDLRHCPPAIAREATEALAVHHEHRARDLKAARRFAVQSLQFNVSITRQQAVQHRLARINRKLEAAGAPLF